MRFIPISEIRLDPAAADLRVLPELPPDTTYDGVYRAALSARWDASSGELYTVDFIGRNPLSAYKQIIAAVADEYRDHLTPTADTVWRAVPDDLRRAILAWHADEPATA